MTEDELDERRTEALGYAGSENPWQSITLTTEEAGGIVDEMRRLRALVEEHRRILEPLLETPWQDTLDDHSGEICRFCGVVDYYGKYDHAEGCIAIPANAARLLGRTAAEVAG